MALRKKIVFQIYDADTAIGINNEGVLAFSYNLEDTDQTESGADVFNGQQSVLWNNIRAAFGSELMAMYQSLRSTGALSYSKVEGMFEEHQSKWPEAVFNEDAWFKYLAPLEEKGSAAYLSMLQGSKAEQRKWWLYNRFRYLDSKYNAGNALTDVITLRGYAKADVTITPYADIYATVKFGSYLVQTRAQRNQSYTLECPLDNVNDTEIYLYSASQLSSVGDLSGLKVGYAEFSYAKRLRSLKLGDSSRYYSNGNLTELHLGNNTLLQTLDVRNCTGLGTGDQKTIDISGCTGIENIYFDGTAIAGLTLPNGGAIKILHLPGTITALTILNQSQITDFTCPDVTNLKEDHEGIVSRELLDKVQERLETMEHETKCGIRRGGREHHPLYGHVFCAECGQPFKRRTMSSRGHSYKAWNCRDRQKGTKGNGCRNAIWKEEELTDAVCGLFGWDAFDEEKFADAGLDLKVDGEKLAVVTA